MKEKEYIVKIGAVKRVVTAGGLQPYIDALWKVIGEVNDKTDTKKTISK